MRRLRWLTAKPYAHRGIHNKNQIENSRAAFEAAINANLGIELDVQASRDGEAIVFHDHALDRLTKAQGPVIKKTTVELTGIRLHGCNETLPTLKEILHLIAGRTPILIEIKSSDRKTTPVCSSVRQTLQIYKGSAAIMSFNPNVGAWFAKNAPEIVRGLVITEKKKHDLIGKLKRHLSLWWAKPDFLAYDIRDLPSRFASSKRKQGLPILAWTVRSKRDKEIALFHADQIIME